MKKSPVSAKVTRTLGRIRTIVGLASENDINAIYTVRTSVRDNYLSRDDLNELGLTEQILMETFIAPSCVWVAEIGGQVVAFSIADMEGGCVFAVFVLPEYEGVGIGRLLMLEAEGRLFNQHKEIWLETDGREAVRANGFYRKLGWRPVATLGNRDIQYIKRREQ